MSNPNIATITATSNDTTVVELTNGTRMKVKTTTDGSHKKSDNVFDWIVIRN
jgi:hypothetical protein